MLINSEMAYQKSKPIIEEIRNNSKCISCGGAKFLNSTCIYCHSTNNDLDKSIRELNTIIKDFDLSDVKINCFNPFLNLLSSLENIEIDTINELLTKFNYQNTMEKIIANLRDGQELNQDTIDTIKSLVKRNEMNEDLTFIVNFTLNKALKKEMFLDYDTFKLLIKNNIEYGSKNLYPNVHCYFFEKKEDKIGNVAGESDHYEIGLSDAQLKKLYTNGNPWIFVTIYHELRHMEQSVEFKDYHYLDDFDITLLKEYVVSIYNETYYTENYYRLSFELDANFHSRDKTFFLLKQLGFDMNEETLRSNEKYKKDLLEKLKDTRRTVNNKPTTTDYELLKILEKNPNILFSFKKLNLFYKMENGVVALKTKDDMQKDYEEKMSDGKIPDDIKESFTKFYSNYLEINESFNR